MCENYTIMSWLKENTSVYPFWTEDENKILAEEFCSFANCYIPEDTFGIANNGILALAAFCQEVIFQGGPSRNRKDCDCAEIGLQNLDLI